MMAKIKVVAASLVAMLALAACGGGPEKNPEKTVRDGISNMYSEVKSATFAVDFQIDAEGPEGAIEGELTFDGQIDQSDPANPLFSLKMGGSGSLDGSPTESMAAEVRFDSESIYLMVSELPVTLTALLPVEGLDQYVGKWYGMALPEDIAASTTYDPDNPDSKALKAALDKHDLVHNLSYEGTDTAGGVEAYRFKGELNKEGLVDFLAEVAEINDQPLTEDEKEQALLALAMIEMEAEVWVGVDDLIFRKFVGNVEVVPPEGEEGSFTMVITEEISDLNEEVNIEAPADAGSLEEAFTEIVFGAAAGFDPSALEGLEVEGGLLQ